MKRTTALFVALTLSGCCPHNVTPSKIRREIKAHGAKETVNKLFADVGKSDWDRMIEGIVSGKQEWLDLVPEIKPETDAGATEDLLLALSEALPKNPKGVLNLIGIDPVVSYPNVCSSPIMEGGTMEEVKEYFASARSALEKLKDPTVEERRVKCLAEINRQEKQLKRR